MIVMLSSKTIIDFSISVKCILIDFLVIEFYIFKIIVSFFASLIKDYALSTPITLILVGFLITKRISNEQLEINERNNQEEILQKYLDDIEKLILDNKLNDDDDNNQARVIAQVKTLTVLRRLTSQLGNDKAIILQFLYDAELIVSQDDCDGLSQDSKLNLESCDFTKVDLQNAFFKGLSLVNVDFKKSNFTNSYFVKSNFLASNFSEANLQNTNFESSYLIAVFFIKTNLKNANFQNTNLTDVKLEGANIEGANFYQSESLGIKDLKLAKNWKKAIFTEAEWDINKRKWIAKDKATNEAKIQEIRNLIEGIVTF